MSNRICHSKDISHSSKFHPKVLKLQGIFIQKFKFIRVSSKVHRIYSTSLIIHPSKIQVIPDYHSSFCSYKFHSRFMAYSIQQNQGKDLECENYNWKEKSALKLSLSLELKKNYKKSFNFKFESIQMHKRFKQKLQMFILEN